MEHMLKQAFTKIESRIEVGAVIMLLTAHIVDVFGCNTPAFYNPDSREHTNWKVVPIESCGVRKGLQEYLTLNTKGAERGQYPWMALINSFNEDGSKVRCGGSIISDQFVLTAAHCVTPRGKITVTLGENSLLNSLTCGDEACTCSESSDLPVHRTCGEKTIIHPDYKPRSDGLHEENDIALIRLEEPIPIYNETGDTHISPICLPAFAKDTQFFENKLLEIAGSGRSQSEDISSSPLQTIRVPVVAQESCENIWSNQLVKGSLCPDRGEDCMRNISDKFICTNGIKGIGLCSGESGVPLMAQVPLDRIEGTSKLFVVGLASQLTGRRKRFSCPDVFTRVSSYMTWILDTIGE